MPGTATETTSGGNRSTYYGFDAAFFKRVFHLHRILFPGFLSYNFLLFGLLITVCGLEQYLAYQVGLLSGTFYKGKKYI